MAITSPTLLAPSLGAVFIIFMGGLQLKVPWRESFSEGIKERKGFAVVIIKGIMVQTLSEWY